MKKILLINFFLTLIISNALSQSTNNQSVKPNLTPSVKTLDSFPIPKKAALWSIIPGGGQIYNRKWAYVKVPIVYAALGTTIYFTTYNQKLYRKFKAADYNLRNGSDSGYSDIPSTTSTTRLRELRDAYFKRTQQMYILTGVTYLLAAAEAFTSAHLAHFDVNDDLSFRVKPSFEPLVASTNALGIGVQLKF